MDGIEDNGVADEGLAEDGSILNSAGDFPSTLDYVNAIRARHNAPPLEFDDEAADHASQAVQAGMDAGSMGHRYGLGNDGIDDGQCISFGTVNDYFVWSMKTGIELWMEEESRYSAASPYGAAHYTQIVWKASTGVGIAMGRSGDQHYIAMNFTPAGNQGQQYDDNVEADQGAGNVASYEESDPGGDDGYQLCTTGNSPYYWKACDGYDPYHDGYYFYYDGDSADDAQWYSYN